MVITREFLNKLKTHFLGRGEYIPRILYRQASNATVANTVTETTLFDTTDALGTRTLPANYLTAGRTLRITAWGYHSTAGTAVNLRFRFKLAGTTMINTANNAMATSVTDRAWKTEVLLTCRSTGASGTVRGQGFTQLGTSATAGVLWEMGSNAAFTVDTTATCIVNLTVEWSVNLAGHTITCSNLLIEAL